MGDIIEDAWFAARHGDLDALKHYFDDPEKINLEQVNHIKTNCNLLGAAVLANNLSCVKYLADKFPQLATEVENNDAPLQIACYCKKDLPIIEFLIQHCKSSVNTKYPNFHMSPLCAALLDTMTETSNDDDPEYMLQLVNILIKNDADVNHFDKCRISGAIDGTPLTRAIDRRDNRILELLLKSGARINLPSPLSSFSCTIFSYAAKSHYCEGMKLLYDKDPKVLRYLDELNVRAVLRHVCSCGCEICEEFLIELQPNIPKFSNDCAKDAITQGNLEIFKKLIQCGVNPIEPLGSDGDTPLNIACRNKRLSIVQYLLQHESFQYYELTSVHPIYPAIASGSVKIVETILNVPMFRDKTQMPKEYKFRAMKTKISIKSHAVSYAVSQIMSNPLHKHEYEEILDVLLKAKYPLDSCEGDSIPALSCVTLPSTNMPEYVTKIMTKLIKNGANVYEMSIQKFDGYHNMLKAELISLHEELNLPDSLLSAFRTSNKPAVEYLLSYWPHPPITLILFMPKTYTFKRTEWFDWLLQFGWQNGHPKGPAIDDRLTLLREQALINKFYDRLCNPTCLQDLSKFAARQYLYNLMPKYSKTLPELIRSLKLPSDVISTLLLLEDKNSETGDAEKFAARQFNF